jgi:hypothetical protein
MYPHCRASNGGEGGIRTLETLITSARFRGGCHQPLDHLSTREVPRPSAPVLSTSCLKETLKLLRAFAFQNSRRYVEAVIRFP